MKIKSDCKWKKFKYRYEVPKKVLKDQFDYLDEEEVDGFLEYRGYWYHLSSFMRASGEELACWDGYAGDSYFSGVVIKVSEDGEEYKIGTYFS